MKFSDRIGATKPKTEFLKGVIDDAIRNGLWNITIAYCINFESRSSRRGIILANQYRDQYLEIFTNFLKLPVDRMGSDDEDCYKIIRDWYFRASWYDIYNFIEFLNRNICDISEYVNKLLEIERSAYRFIDGLIAPITDETEISEIENARNSSDKFAGARAHIERAIEAFSKKPNGDYLNTIKESISAVESCCKIISKKDNATLGDALKIMDSIKPMHPAFRESFLKLYGYASDEQGIRHALLDDKVKVDEADAHFMLVICSAFVNISVQKYLAT